MLLVKLELVDGLGDDLLQHCEETLVDDYLGKVWPVDEVGLDEEVPHCIHSHQVHLMLQLIHEFKHSCDQICC